MSASHLVDQGQLRFLSGAAADLGCWHVFKVFSRVYQVCLRECAPVGCLADWRKWAAAWWCALQCKTILNTINLVQCLEKKKKEIKIEKKRQRKIKN